MPLLSAASSVRLGATRADRLYLGGTLIWPPGMVGTTGLLAGTAPRPSGALAAATGTTGLLAGASPRPSGALTTITGTTGLLVGTAPVPSGALTTSAANAGALAGYAPMPTGALTTATGGGGAETFAGADGSSWPSPWTGGSGAAVDQQGGAGRLATAASTFSQAYIRRTAPADGEVLLKWKPVDDLSSVDVAVRAAGAGYGDNPKWTFRMLADRIWLKWEPSGSLDEDATVTHSAGTWYWARVRWQGATVQGRTWADGGGEPGTWNVEVTDTAGPTSGHLILRVETDDATADTALFDDITLTDLTTSAVTGALAGTTPATAGAMAGTVGSTGSGFGSTPFGSTPFGSD